MIGLCHTAIAFATAMLCAITAPVAADAKLLAVGPDRVLKVPSQAAAVAANGDVIRIDPGTYTDCAVWRASHLLIEAAGPGVRITGTVCGEKALFVTQGAKITVRGITFADATVVWHNAAGIRVEGPDLTVEHSRFLNNENGILAGGDPNSVLRITDSEFIGNGSCIAACAHGVYAGAPIYLLDIERCVFRETKTAHHIKSRALNTIVRGTLIEDGPAGTSSYLIDVPNGGNVVIQGNRMEKGPLTGNPSAAISIGIEGVTNPTDSLVIRDNVFRSDVAKRTTFVRNSSAIGVEMLGNTITGNVLESDRSKARVTR
jgi:hypothetical protein